GWREWFAQLTHDKRAARLRVPRPGDSPFSAELSGEKSRGDEGRDITSPISSWPGLARGPSAHGLDPWAPTPRNGRDQDVDTRIKSAQDDFRSFPASET